MTLSSFSADGAAALGRDHHVGGRTVEARTHYRRALAAAPQQPMALHGLGLLAAAGGDFPSAGRFVAAALALHPGDVGLACDLGRMRLVLGRPREAASLFRRALAIAPDGPEAHFGTGTAALDLGGAEPAVAAFRRAVAVRAGYADALYNLGNAFVALGRAEAAARAFRSTVSAASAFVPAWANLGHALKSLGRFDEARASYRTALAIEPGWAEAHYNLSHALSDLREPRGAIAGLRRALALDPGYADAANNLGGLLLDRGRVAEAGTWYRHAVASAPGRADLLSNLLFYLCFNEHVTPDEAFKDCLVFDRRHIAPLAAQRRRHHGPRDPDRRLRIGYLSPDFRRHPSGHFVLPMFEHHERSRFEVVAYADNPIEDEVTARFRDRADRWDMCWGITDDQLADRIAADGINILVECSGHMAGNRLTMLARKPAPIQVSFPVYPGTTGASVIDYRIMDRFFAPPGAEAYHSEAIVRLPDAHVCYWPYRQAEPAAEAPPSSAGAPFTFGSFNNIAKIGDRTIAIWSRILREAPGSRLLVKWKGLRDRTDVPILERLAAHGVTPDRVALLEWSDDPYAAYRMVDVCLDPLPVNGGTTTCDALWMGVPVVTLAGDHPFGRVGLCHLTTVGLPELVAETADDYVRLAVALATDPARLIRLRTGLRQRTVSSPLMDRPRYTRHLEAAYRTMWATWCDGRPATSFDVPA